MVDYKFVAKNMWALILTALLLIQESESIRETYHPNRPSRFQTDGSKFPTFPLAYSTNIQLNYMHLLRTIEVRRSVNLEEKKTTTEVFSEKKHIKYIERGDRGFLLVIDYKPDQHAVCTVSPLSSGKDLDESYIESEYGPIALLRKLDELMKKTDEFKLNGISYQGGMACDEWRASFNGNKTLLQLFVANENWNPAHREYLLHEKKLDYAQINAHFDSKDITLKFSNFIPTSPDDIVFQPDEDVFCEGYVHPKKPPIFTDYFSYLAEIIVYEGSEGLAPVVSHRKVYYDYPGEIVRIDLQDAMAKDGDMFSEVLAKPKTIIHDFKTGVQYDYYPITGECKIDQLGVTFDSIFVNPTGKNEMLNAKQFFHMDTERLSYNGQYPMRGLMTDEFVGLAKTSQGVRHFQWYFTTDRTQLVENDRVEKNVLLKIVTRPETSDGFEGATEINFFNFIKEEPKPSIFDFSVCYNYSNSKILVFTFPGNDKLLGFEDVVKSVLWEALVDVTGVNKHRIVVKDVYSKSSYIFAPFKILDLPPIGTHGTQDLSKESTTDEAVAKLNKAIAAGSFSVNILLKNDVEVILKPEPDGLNDYSGNRRRRTEEGYKEGSVIALTVGILILGFLLGSITINLAMSRKYGVSLFQNVGGKQPLGHPLDESSI